MLLAIRPDTRMVWIANPNNPTGTFLPHAQLRVFLEALPQHVVAVLDEAQRRGLIHPRNLAAHHGRSGEGGGRRTA